MKQFAYIGYLLLCLSCNKNYQSSDLIADGIFASYAVEGPVVDAQGRLFAVNFRENGTIGVVESGTASEFVRLPEGSTGNGIRIGSDGSMYVADYTGHNVLKINPKTKEISVFAHEPSMNQPNDLAISQDDFLFASDPNWSDSTGNIWRISPQAEVVKLDSNMGTTNGITLSPDNTQLYVNESIQRKIWVYDLTPSKQIQNKRLFASFPDFGCDGMRCDGQGNLYVARYGAGYIAQYNPAGKLLRKIMLKGKKPSNIAFGGKDGKTAYVTMHERGAIETFRIK